MMVIGIFLITLGCVLVVGTTALIIHMHIQHQRAGVPHNVLPRLSQLEPIHYDVRYTPLVEVNDIFRAWYQALQECREEAWFSTYVWHYHDTELQGWATPHIYLLGIALKHLDDQLDHPVPVRFLINHSRMMMAKDYVQTCYNNTMDLWRHIGFKGRHVHVEFRVWRHNLLNNIHGKLLIVDHRHTIMTSINVEQESYGGPNSWYESGGWVQHDAGNVADQHRNFLQKHYDQADPLTYAAHRLDTNVRSGWLSRSGEVLDPEVDLATTLPAFDRVALWWRHDDARSNLYLTDHLQSNISAELARLILKAQRTVDVLTPTFNHPLIWEAIVDSCTRNPTLRVRIMVGWEFNVTHPWIQKHMLGYPTNAEFVKNRLWHPQIQWRWFANENGDMVHRDSGSMSHAKVVIIDREYCKCSSYNVDVWSSLNSMETAFFLRSAPVADYYRHKLFEPLWQRAIPITEQNRVEKRAR